MNPDLDTILENFEHLDLEMQLLYAYEYEDMVAEDCDGPFFISDTPFAGPSETLIHKLFY